MGLRYVNALSTDFQINLSRSKILILILTGVPSLVYTFHLGMAIYTLVITFEDDPCFKFAYQMHFIVEIFFEIVIEI